MGPLGGILKMLPGYSQYADLIDENQANNNMKKTKAIIQSMTPAERRSPEKLRGTMKRRIAAGSGTTVTDVNRLITQFEKTKKAMDAFSSMQRSGNLNEENLQKMMNRAEAQANQVRLNNRRKKYKF